MLDPRGKLVSCGMNGWNERDRVGIDGMAGSSPTTRCTSTPAATTTGPTVHDRAAGVRDLRLAVHQPHHRRHHVLRLQQLHADPDLGHVLVRRRPGDHLRGDPDPGHADHRIAIWEWAGYNSLLLYTALRSVPRDIVETAILDDTPLWKIIVKVNRLGSSRSTGRRCCTSSTPRSTRPSTTWAPRWPWCSASSSSPSR